MSIEIALNRLLATIDSPNKYSESIAVIEKFTSDAAANSTAISEEVMGQCAELLETLPVDSTATRVLVNFLANACLSETNKLLAGQYGIPSTCILLLQHHSDLENDTLYHILDLITTLSASSGNRRALLRPAIPYIIGLMNARNTALNVLFAGCCALCTLGMLDNANCELICSQGGLQTLINAFQFAIKMRKKGPQSRSFADRGSMPALEKSKTDHAQELCNAIVKWSRDAAMKVMHASSIVVDECLKNIDFGPAGSVLEVDELQWDLRFERRRALRQTSSIA